jgi:phospholipid N-methyltransferase
MPNARYIPTADVAKLIRADLKEFFPGVTFSVRSRSYSMGSSIDVTWTDGPTAKEVEALVKKYAGSTFDGMQDLKTHHDSYLNGELVHFASDHVFCKREASRELVQMALDKVVEEYCLDPVPTLNDDNWVNDQYRIVYGHRDLGSILHETIGQISLFARTAPRTSGIQIEKTEGGFFILGDTYTKRSIIKGAGGKWDKAKTAWFIAGDALPEEINALTQDTETSSVSSPAQRFREMADKMQSAIDDKRRDRLANTHRRARMAESALQDALDMEKVQSKLRALADCWDAGNIPEILRGVISKNVVERLTLSRYFPSVTHDKPLYKAFIKAGIGTEKLFFDAKSALEQLGDPNAGQKTAADLIKDKERELIGTKIPGYFPTPRPIIERMLKHANIRPGQRVLEPSAGKGNIADVIREKHPDTLLDVVEWMHSLRELLKLKGHNVIGSDCFELSEPIYDIALANPPFENFSDIDHVRHYFTLLKPGGRLVAIMSNSPFFRHDKKAEEFREWLSEVGWDEELPDDAFKDSERPTGVKTRLVIIDKSDTKPKREPLIDLIRDIAHVAVTEKAGETVPAEIEKIAEAWIAYEEANPSEADAAWYQSWERFWAANPPPCDMCGKREHLVLPDAPKGSRRCWPCLLGETKEAEERVKEAGVKMIQNFVKMGYLSQSEADAWPNVPVKHSAIIPISECMTLREATFRRIEKPSYQCDGCRKSVMYTVTRGNFRYCEECALSPITMPNQDEIEWLANNFIRLLGKSTAKSAIVTITAELETFVQSVNTGFIHAAKLRDDVTRAQEGLRQMRNDPACVFDHPAHETWKDQMNKFRLVEWWAQTKRDIATLSTDDRASAPLFQGVL